MVPSLTCITPIPFLAPVLDQTTTFSPLLRAEEMVRVYLGEKFPLKKTRATLAGSFWPKRERERERENEYNHQEFLTTKKANNTVRTTQEVANLAVLP